jgi:hypothetical protein
MADFFTSAIRHPPSKIPLRGFGLSAYLFLDLPVREEILMAASRAFPGSFDGIGTAHVEHLNNQVTVQAHCRVT